MVCTLHLVEKVLHNVLEDKSIIGPSKKVGYSSETGDQIAQKNLKSLEIADFSQIEVNNFPDFSSIERKTSLTNDQDYLYMICQAIRTKDEEYIELVKKYEPGTMGHARWLTTGSRNCRVYISEKDPDQGLVAAVQTTVAVYAPVFFNIKKSPGFASGPKIFFEIVQRTRDNEDLPVHVKEIIYRTLTTNSFFAHPENILVAMLLDSDQQIRKLGIEYVLLARINLNKKKEADQGKKKRNPRTEKTKLAQQAKEQFKFRTFKHPSSSKKEGEIHLNFEAKCYYELVDLDQNIYEPPITMGLTKEELENFTIPPIPNNSQCVEFFVQEVYKEATNVSSDDRRNGNVLIKDFYRKNKMGDVKTVSTFEGKKFALPKGFRPMIMKFFPEINYN